MQMHLTLQGIQVMFVYEGYRVKVNVTGVKCDPDTPGLGENMTATAVMASPFQSFSGAARRWQATESGGICTNFAN